MATNVSPLQLLPHGRAAFEAMLAAIANTTASLKLESYIYADDPVGRDFLASLIEAAQRGVRVQILVDAFGSYELDAEFFRPLQAVGGEVRWFNPIQYDRFAIRNHRKLLICDDRLAVVGGFNLAQEYNGDGLNSGWCDLGMQLSNPLVTKLSASFDEMFELAEFRHKLFSQFRKSAAKQQIAAHDCELLLTGPGRGFNPLKRALLHDFAHADRIQIVSAYFLPPLRMRRALRRAAQRGARVQLILAGKSDVPISRTATQSLYRRFLAAGIEIYEYEPQILHAKLVLTEEAVYVGSSNIDPRSLDFNYELMVRVENQALRTETSAWFKTLLSHSRAVTVEQWCTRSWLDKLRQRWAYFVVAQFDQFVTRRQLQRLK